MVLCPVASATAIEFLQIEPPHDHNHGDTDSSVASIDLACPIGSSIFFAAIPNLEAPDLETKQQFAVPLAPVLARYTRNSIQPNLARGPPAS